MFNNQGNHFNDANFDQVVNSRSWKYGVNTYDLPSTLTVQARTKVNETNLNFIFKCETINAKSHSSNRSRKIRLKVH